MRKLILALSLLLSFSFACDQPHEQVGDYKVGCPFDGGKGFKVANTLERDGKKVTGYSKKNTSQDLFYEENLVAVDGNLVLVSFELNKHMPSNMLQSIIDRWGEPIPKEELTGYLRGLREGSIVIFPENSVIESIIIDPYSIIYKSKGLTRLSSKDEKEDYSRY